MINMVLLDCEIGSKAALVLCPTCGRISRQILAAAYSDNQIPKLIRPHTCPVCSAVYEGCDSERAQDWMLAHVSYNRNADAYNQSIKENYANSQKDSATARATTKSEPEQKTVSDYADKPREAEKYWYCGVSFTDMPQASRFTYSYISDIGRLAIGTFVEVPYGHDDKKRIGIVKSCEQYDRENAPYPVRQTKHIIRTASKDEYDAANQTPPLFTPSLANQTSNNDGLHADVERQTAALKASTANNGVSSTITVNKPASPSPELERKIEFWKSQLLDTGKRNKMINYKDTKRTTLRILEPEATELFNKLAFSEKPLTFQKPISKDSDLRTYSMIALMETLSYTLNVQVGDIKTSGTVIEREKTLKNLRSKAKLAQEEQGTNILYMCFGFIYWRAQNREGSQWFKAPLLVMPVALGLKSLNAPYTISKTDDEIEVNPTLEYLFSTEYNIDLPAFDPKNKDSFDEYIAQIEQIVDKRGWKVAREVSLGLLSFLKISMYHDLENNRELLVQHPVIRAMAGDRTALAEIPAQAEGFDFDSVRPGEWHEVIDADSSQEEAILLSKLGVSFVMQGPPGTGKSQTITNIIAEALADGKKVLFVSEKAAALQVVLKRLSEVHLDDFCLSLHNYKANKKEIIDSIGANLSLRSEYLDNTALSELTELYHDRQFLNTYASELHRVVSPLNQSLYTAFGKLAKLDNASTVEFSLTDPTEVSQEQYASILYCVAAFEKALHNMGGALTSNPWYGTTATSSGQTYKQQLLHDTENLSEDLRKIEKLARIIASSLSMDCGNSITEIKRLLAVADVLRKNTHYISRSWFDPNVSSRAHARLEEAQNHTKTLRQCAQAVQTDWDNSVYDLDLDSMQNGLSSNYSWFYDDAIDALIEEKLERERTTAEALLHSLEEIVAAYQDALGILAYEQIDATRNIQMISRVLALISEAPYMESSWLDARKNAEFLPVIEDAVQHSEKVAALTEKLLESWEPSIIDVDADSILSRFRTNYTAAFLEANEKYEKDIELLRHSAKTVELSIDNTTITELLQKVLAIRDEDKWFEDKRSAIEAALGNQRYVEAIAWQSVRAEIESAQSIIGANALLRDAARRSAQLSEVQQNILKDWEPSIFDIDVDGMLARFKTEYIGILHKTKASYKEDIRTLRLNAKAVGVKIDEEATIALLQKLKRYNDEKKWFDDQQELFAAVLGDLYDGLKTDWNKVRSMVVEAQRICNALPLLEEAIRRGSIVEENKDELLKRWDSNILGIDAENMLARFRSEYVGNFYDKRISYEKDLEILRCHSKSIDLRASGEKVLQAIQSVRDIKREKQWFSDNSQKLTSATGNYYCGEATEWRRVRDSMSIALKISNQFPYGSISDATISALLQITESMQLSGEAKRLSESLSSEKIATIESELKGARYITNYSADVSLSESVLSQISGFVDYCATQKEFAAEMKTAKKDGVLTYGDIKTLVQNLRKIESESTWFDNHQSENQMLFADAYCDASSDWIGIRAGIETAEELAKMFDQAVPDAAIEYACAKKDDGSTLFANVTELTDLLDKAEPKLIAFVGQFETSAAQPYLMQNIIAIAERYDACMDNYGELNKWLDYVETRSDCDKHGLRDFTEKIAAADNTIPDVQDAFEKGFYIQWLTMQLDRVPSVQSFRKRVHEERSERFVKLDSKQYEIARKSVRKKIIDTYPQLNRVARAGSELSILRHEMEKKRRIMPLRKLFRSISKLLLDLKPCLMMSPLSVAYFLEADAYQFDMVIFDEASQIFPQDAIGAICRAKQVVIAGDTKQLPPTNFFSTSTNNSDDGFDGDEDDYNEEVYDSILEETANTLPNRTLLWHYRSRHEHLIAFSNQEIYKNELVTFPSSNENEPDTGVEFVYVEDGYYEPSPKNHNLLEAQRCVQLVKEHIDKHPDRSLGIIAFSEKQQQAIALEVQRFREKNPKYEDFFAEGKEDEFFVKNLENVQGDERDTIIFSVGYAKTKEQKANNRPMSMRFGPLGTQGGERRLNVAITRAKINVKLVSSILPSDIDLSRTESDGIRMLRSYIEFARNGEASLAAAQKDSRPDDFADAIAEFIRSHGYNVKQYVGCSGYKIDIAVQHPSETVKQFVAGIECDGFSYVSARTARDRDRLRSSVLKRMGWNLYRIWSAEWYKNPEVEGQKLLAFIQKAIQDCDDKIKALEAERKRAEDAKRIKEALQQAEERRIARERELEEAKRIAEQEAAKQKKREEAAQRAAKRKAERESERAAAEKKRREEAERQRKYDLSWAVASARVKHKQFGVGTVASVSKNQITVRFGADTRTFAYPDVIYNDLLESLATPVQQKSAIPKNEWVKVGTTVSHKIYGDGTVEQITGTVVRVKFGNEVKAFGYPSAFADGHLVKVSNEPDSKGQASDQISLFPTKRPDLLKIFTEKGFACIDNRATSSILWVLYDAEKTEVFDHIIKDYNVQCRLERRGSLATSNKAAWRIMITE